MLSPDSDQSSWISIYKQKWTRTADYICIHYLVKNISNNTLHLTLRVYFLGSDGKPFYDTSDLIATDWGDFGMVSDREESGPMKPGYARTSQACIWAEKTDLSLWKEGAYKIDIEKIEAVN